MDSTSSSFVRAPRRLSAQEALRAAVKAGDPRKIVRALSLGADAKRGVEEKTGNTLLMQAVLDDQPAALRTLLPHSDAFARNQKGLTAFLIAAQLSRTECLQVLSQTPGIANVCDLDGRTALSLHISSTLDYRPFSAFPLLLSLCDAKQPDRSGNTALMLLAQRRAFDPQQFSALLTVSDPQAVDAEHVNALMLAQSPQAIQALIPVSSLLHVDAHHRDALSSCILSGGDVDCIELLLDACPQANPLAQLGALRSLAWVGELRGRERVLARIVAREDPASSSFQEAVRLATQKKDWVLCEALAPWLSDAQLQRVEQYAPWQTLPRVCARLAQRERDALAQSLDSTASPTHTMGSPDSSSVPLPAKELPAESSPPVGESVKRRVSRL